jgi:iron complex transport system substrate-binding protein
MKRWLLLFIAFPLLSHAAAERFVTLGGDVTESSMPWTRTAAGGAGQHQHLACRRRKSCRTSATAAERRGDPRVTPELVLASAQAQPRWSYKSAGERVKVVNVPGGESLSAIDNKVAVIADALGKTAAGDAAPAASAADRRHSHAAGC